MTDTKIKYGFLIFAGHIWTVLDSQKASMEAKQKSTDAYVSMKLWREYINHVFSIDAIWSVPLKNDPKITDKKFKVPSWLKLTNKVQVSSYIDGFMKTAAGDFDGVGGDYGVSEELETYDWPDEGELVPLNEEQVVDYVANGQSVAFGPSIDMSMSSLIVAGGMACMYALIYAMYYSDIEGDYQLETLENILGAEARSVSVVPKQEMEEFANELRDVIQNIYNYVVLPILAGGIAQYNRQLSDGQLRLKEDPQFKELENAASLYYPNMDSNQARLSKIQLFELFLNRGPDLPVSVEDKKKLSTPEGKAFREALQRISIIEPEPRGRNIVNFISIPKAEVINALNLASEKTRTFGYNTPGALIYRSVLEEGKSDLLSDTSKNPNYLDMLLSDNGLNRGGKEEIEKTIDANIVKLKKVTTTIKYGRIAQTALNIAVTGSTLAGTIGTMHPIPAAILLTSATYYEFTMRQDILDAAEMEYSNALVAYELKNEKPASNLTKLSFFNYTFAKLMAVLVVKGLFYKSTFGLQKKQSKRAFIIRQRLRVAQRMMALTELAYVYTLVYGLELGVGGVGVGAIGLGSVVYALVDIASKGVTSQNAISALLTLTSNWQNTKSMLTDTLPWAGSAITILMKEIIQLESEELDDRQRAALAITKQKALSFQNAVEVD